MASFAESKMNGSRHNLVSCPAADPFTRGVALGRALAPLARELHGLLAGVWFGHLANEWAAIAGASLKALAAHAPVSLGELRGFASALDGCEGASGDGMTLLLMLGSERELGMLNAQRAAGFRSAPLGGHNSDVDDVLPPAASSPADCSGLVWSRLGPGARSLLGHATDLTPEFYLSGRATRICHLAGGTMPGDEDQTKSYPACLCINFAGVGCIGGTNACGLTISRFTVDTGERNLNRGVPIYFLVREALTRRTLEDAVEFLRGCPRTLPYAFHLAQAGRAVGVECSPSAFTVTPAVFAEVAKAEEVAVAPVAAAAGVEGAAVPRAGSPTVYSGVRANHCLIDPGMIRTEIGAHHLAALGGQNDKSSVARQASLQHALGRMVAREGAEPDVAGVQAALLASPVTNETTMFCFVAESEEGAEAQRLHVQFFGEGPRFHTYVV